MPLERLVLIIVIVLALSAVSVWVAAVLISAWALPWYGSLAILSVTALVHYIVGRMIGERLTNREDDKYDGIDN